jgi:outer membrane lipoprotein-sorting protein
MYAFALLLAAGPAAPPAPSEADLLLREMDATITAARALRVEFEIRNDRPGKGEQVLKGSLVLGERNRLRFEQTGWLTASAVSDGRRTVIVTPDERRARETPGWFNDVLKGWLGRGGTYVSVAKAFDLLDGPSVQRPGPADGPRVTDAKVLADEQAGGVKCRVVEYDLAWVEHPAVSGADAARVRVWIDPRTHLPVRRTMTFPIADRADTYTATHTSFEIDPKLDDKLFELPK